MAQADGAKRKQPSNRLKAETPFVCNVHFRADLPEVPGEPKLLVTPLQPEKLAQFRLTSLETSAKRALVLEADWEIPINLLGIERFDVPAEPPRLAPEDEALLEPEPGARATDARDGTAQAVDKQELSWLMRTTYISNEEKARRQQQTEATDQYSDLLEDELQAIEAGFLAGGEDPVHPTNPGLRAVEVLPILPDFDNWANKYVAVTFDDDPAREYPPLARLTSGTQRAAAQGVLKSYTTRNDSTGNQERIVALMLPKRTADSDDLNFDEDTEFEYEWVREYKFRFDHDPDDEAMLSTCVLTIDDDRVAYNRIGSRMALQKRPRGTIDRPSRLTLRKRELTEAEEEERAAIRQRLDPAEDDGAYSAGVEASLPSPSLSE